MGNGWDFIDKTKTKAEFRSAKNIGEVNPLWRSAKFLCNTNPYGSDIVHERIVMGLLFNCMTLSDSNSWLDENLGSVEGLTRYDWSGPLDEQLQPVLANPDAGQKAQSGHGAAYDLFLKGGVGTTSYRPRRKNQAICSELSGFQRRIFGIIFQYVEPYKTRRRMFS